MNHQTETFIKNDYSSYRDRFKESQIVGMGIKLFHSLRGDFSYESSNINDNDVDVFRNALHVGLSYTDENRLFYYTKHEYRKDEGGIKRRQYVTQNCFEHQFNKDFELFSKLNYARTWQIPSKSEESEFLEMTTGLSYRPVDFNWINLLTKHSYILNMNPAYREDFVFHYRDLRSVFSLESVLKLNRFFELNLKYATRLMKEKMWPRNWVRSTVDLKATRLNVYPLKTFYIGSEYRILQNKDIHDEKKGWLIECGKEIKKYFSISTGYNFTDYHDDLRYNDNYESKGWYIRVNGKY